MPRYVERWTRIGLSTAPSNRPAAEECLVRAYAQAKLKPPVFKWFGSPLSAALDMAVALLREHPTLGPLHVGDSDDAVKSHLAGEGDTARFIKDSIQDSLSKSGYGCHDASWLAFHCFMREVLGLRKETEPLVPLMDLAEHTGWYIPYENICWMSERPCAINRDDEGRAHCATGPAIAYPDGWSVYLWHGIRVPEEWILHPADMDPVKVINWPNIEQRRAAMEIMGWERVLTGLDAKVINEDPDPQIGTLLEADLPDAPGSRFLRVKCGTGRDFVIPVPREMNTALEANAATYGLEPEALRNLEIRT